MKAFYFKVLCFFIIFSNFTNFNFFSDFWQKTSNKLERHFEETMASETHSGKKFGTFSDFQKIPGFFRNDPSIFPKNPPNFQLFENFYHSSRILRKIGNNLVKKSSIFRNVNEHRFSVNVIGKHRVKKVGYGPFQRKIFFFYILQSMAQNNKTASYHRHIIRLPIFVKNTSKTMKAFFPKCIQPSSYYLILPTLKIF